MSHPKLPVWNSKTSTVKNPVLLFEGRHARIVDEDEITNRVDGGRSIFVERLGSRTIRTDPRKVAGEDGKEKILYAHRTVKCARRLSSPGGLRGESSKMTPGRPTNGKIERSPYAVLLDAFSKGDERAIRLFRARKTPRHKGGVTRENQMRTAERAILYMPHTGQLTGKPKPSVTVI